MRIFAHLADIPAMHFLLFLFVLALAPLTGSATAQQRTAVGVVWTPAGPPEVQVEMLQTMHGVGVQHIRVAAWPHSDALQAAHTFGLKLYMDLSPAVALTPARHTHLAHPAVHGVGWAGPLTPSGCARWNALKSRIPSAPMHYVVAPVPPSGTDCTFADSTTVLGDVRLLSRPFDRWYAWKHAHNGPVGLAALGPARSTSGAEGWRIPRSQMAQARALEDLLHQVHARGVPLAFTAGWSAASNPGPLQFHLTQDARLLPPGQVVVASTEGGPRPFAWPPGPERSASAQLPYSATLAIGLLLLGIAGALTQMRPVRRTVTRYLFAHGFYRESLHGGRDATLPTLSALGLLVVGALWGGGWAMLHQVAWTRSILLGLEALPPALRSIVASALQQPGIAALLVAGAIAFGLLFWTTLLTLALQTARSSLSWLQILTMGLLPWWGAPLWMVAALLPTSIIGSSAPLALLASALVGSAWSALRTAYDLHRTAHPPVGVTVGAALLAPGSLLLIGLVIAGYATGTNGLWIMRLMWQA